jgi:hypothetical protein
MAFFLQVIIRTARLILRTDVRDSSRNDTAGGVGAAGRRVTGWRRKLGINSRCQASAGAINQHDVDGNPVPPGGRESTIFVDNVGRGQL